MVEMPGINQDAGDRWILLHLNKINFDLELKETRVTFGRARDSTFSFRSVYISKDHAVMVFNGNKWTIRDLKSTNGVFIGNKRISPKDVYYLNEGDIIGLGMPCNCIRPDFDAVYKLAKIPANNNKESPTLKTENLQVNNDVMNGPSIEAQPIANGELNATMDIVHNQQIPCVEVMNDASANAESNGEDFKEQQTPFKRRMKRTTAAVARREPQLVDLTSSDTEDADAAKTNKTEFSDAVKTNRTEDSDAVKTNRTEVSDAVKENLIKTVTVNKNPNDELACIPSTSTGITHSLHKLVLGETHVTNNLNPIKFDKLSSANQEDADKQTNVEIKQELEDDVQIYSQEDEVIFISDDDDDDVAAMEKNLKIKEEPNDEWDKEYRRRLLETIMDSSFNNDCEPLFYLTDSVKKEISEDDLNSWIQLADDPTNITISENDDSGQIHISETVNDKRQLQANEPETSVDMPCDWFPVLSQEFTQSDEENENVSGEDFDMVAQPATDDQEMVTQPATDESDNEDSDINLKTVEKTEKVTNVAIKPQTYPIPIGKHRIAHQVDRLKQSSRNPSRLVEVTEAQRLLQQRRSARVSAPSTIPKSKQSSIKSKVLKAHGNRIRTPGGGSAIPCKSISERTANDNLKEPKHSTDGASTSGIIETSVAESKQSNVTHKPVAKAAPAKVSQRGGASRNARLLESMSELVNKKPLNKRLQNNNSSGPLPKRLRSNSGDNSSEKEAEIQKLVQSNRLIWSNLANICRQIRPIATSTVASGARDEVPQRSAPQPLRSESSTDGLQPTRKQVRFSSTVETRVFKPYLQNLSCKENSDDEGNRRDEENENCSGQEGGDRRAPEGGNRHILQESNQRSLQESNLRALRENNQHVNENNQAINRNDANRRNNLISQFIGDVLHWNHSWINEQKICRGDPPVVKHPIKNVALSYSSNEEYANVYGQLIKTEYWRSVTEDFELFEQDPYIMYVYVGDSTSSQTDNDVSTFFCGYGVTNARNAVMFRAGCLGVLYFTPKDNRTRRNVFAYIEVCDKMEMNKLPPDLQSSKLLANADKLVFGIRIRVKKLHEAVNKVNYMKLKLINYLTPEARLFSAVHELRYKPLVNCILNPATFVRSSQRSPALRTNLNDHDLNESQINAVSFAVDMCLKAPNEPRISLIHGPPGTGKTKVIVSIIRELIIESKKKNTEIKILVCAPSNGAVNEITDRLIQLRKQDTPLHLVRVGQCNNMTEDVLKFTMDKYVERWLQERDNNENRRRMGIIDFKRKVIAQSNVITTTLGSVTRVDMEKLHDFRNIICIIDEATQCVEPEALLPLEYHINKLILVGDHKQLPATVKSKTAMDCAYNRSLFERLHMNWNGVKDGPVSMLTIQHRMDIKLCSYPSRAFYENTLQTANHALQMSDSYPFAAYRVFDLCDGQEFKIGKDIMNQTETNFVLMLCQAILEDIPNVNIGIITFYSGQKSCLEKRKQTMLQNKGKCVEINTVDAFQGREKDVVILSAVRANNLGEVGFTGNPNRLNVSLTRARFGLYVVGKKATLQNNNHWKEMFEDARHRNCYALVSSGILKERLLAHLRK